MKYLKNYYYIFFILLGIFVLLITMNINIIKQVKKYKGVEKYNQTLINAEKEKSQLFFGYSEIIKELKDNNFTISSIRSDESSSVCIETEFLGNINSLNKNLNKLITYKNFLNVDNITYFAKDNKIVVAMKFIKNK